ncbi:MAG: response regulator transcription factor [Candidatus Melainabacteria bacterium]|nr:response regulator transcription factor [Candidatus Melainabacteria bacterium]
MIPQIPHVLGLNFNVQAGSKKYVMSKILLAEDEALLANEISEWLQYEHYIVDVARNGAEAENMLRTCQYDVLILDWMLPGISGVDICKRYRANGGQTPILILTARSSIQCKETGLDSGADDYLTKPFQLKELSARIRSLLRRAVVAPSTKLQITNITIDPKARLVLKDGVEIHLEPREFNLLEFLFRHPNVLFTSEALIGRVWESHADITAETLRSYVKSLRKKIDRPGHPSIITTVHGSGYMVRTY